MKIIAFNQLRNELSKGNLENWFRSVSFCDYIYIYDQNSDDGSKEYYKKFPNVKVIESPVNDFANELICKQKLLDMVLIDHPDVDWIFSIDGDIVLDGRLCKNPELIRGLCENNSGADAIAMGHYNLWRSDKYYRVDNMFHYIDQNGLPVLWKNTGNLQFDNKPGLHQAQYPKTIKNAVKCGYYLIHRGFATDYQILEKIKVYKSMQATEWPKGIDQKKYTIHRFMHEDELLLGRVPDYIFPEWYSLRENDNPFELKPMIKVAPEFV